MQVNPDITFVFRAAVSLGFTEKMTAKYGQRFIVNASARGDADGLHDSIFAQNIILGVSDDIWLRNKAKRFASILIECMEGTDIPVVMIKPQQVESMMLYSI